MTRESHAWWRYAATVDGRPGLSAEDELLLNRDEEATRVATTTERLIRTQAAHPREFHRVLDDGAAIAEPSPTWACSAPGRESCGRGAAPSPIGAFLLFNNYGRANAPGRAGTARPCHGRVRVAPLAHAAAAAPARKPRGTYGRMRAPAHRRGPPGRSGTGAAPAHARACSPFFSTLWSNDVTLSR